MRKEMEIILEKEKPPRPTELWQRMGSPSRRSVSRPGGEDAPSSPSSSSSSSSFSSSSSHPRRVRGLLG